jgi:alpha-D-ribose 1-methylphosphonate 5-triphosphate synthase subunit PhnG
LSLSNRARRIRALSLGDRDLLAALMDELGPMPEVELLRGPERGLIMVQGRLDGGGSPFNLGDLLLTRCAVRAGGHVGHGFRAGDEPEAAFLAALADALAENPDRAPAIGAVVAKLEAALAAAEAAEAERTLKTKVEFLTMARGEDDG